ncbi:response regulator [Lichenicoccus roseus]|uniref:Response regulator n=1 Tax=Lichenicoccus roseus TaxID=2683649 RepID=A0A5R9IYD3_9PROT|nr:response regulator [Lichenicoccus roseus]TLU70485.1 response regulator [Lichenicoccus roseus]
MDRKTIRILVAEDDDFTRLLLIEFLDGAGYDTLAARDGSKARHLIDDPDGIDVLVTDVNMPGSHGISVARHLRELRPGVPVVFVTGQPEQVEGRKLFAPFAQFPEHFNLSDLVESVSKMLDTDTEPVPS